MHRSRCDRNKKEKKNTKKRFILFFSTLSASVLTANPWSVFHVPAACELSLSLCRTPCATVRFHFPNRAHVLQSIVERRVAQSGPAWRGCLFASTLFLSARHSGELPVDTTDLYISWRLLCFCLITLYEVVDHATTTAHWRRQRFVAVIFKYVPPPAAFLSSPPGG